MIEWLLPFFENRTFGAIRSSRWRQVRAKFLEKYPNSAVCGGRKTIEIHHILPFHIYPDMELEERNLITLCESGMNGIVCHRAIGHLGNYQSYNKNVVMDAKLWREKISQRP